MIGVICNSEQRAVAEEFFQLFKTPWEFFREGETYEVVLTTAARAPETNASLILIFGSAVKSCDRAANLNPRVHERGAFLRSAAGQVPLYGEALLFAPGQHRVVCATSESDIVGLEIRTGKAAVLRFGYDLFQEIEYLLTVGQSLEHAAVPTLELHIALLREMILGAGIPLVEIASSPAGCDFSVCLTHDIDFVGIRRHKFDHTMWGFLYRSTLGAICDLVLGRLSPTGLLKRWKAAATLPFIHLGWAEDFWTPFEWYLKVEKDLSPTWFFIPFKGRAGDKVSVNHGDRRACAYDITDIPEWITRLKAEGCEIGVHGIDAWHSVHKGREEKAQVAAITKDSVPGIRMHWLLRDEDTFPVLEKAGYAYDSTNGYNETPGYRAGTSQVFRPLNARELLELPMHIQDGALFFQKRAGLSETQAWERCQAFILNARRFGGVLTVLWHDRSFGPERFWGDFYVRLVARLKTLPVWFATGLQMTSWFRLRRSVKFERVRTAGGNWPVKLCRTSHRINPALKVRVYAPGTRGNFSEFAWDGANDFTPAAAPAEAEPSSGQEAEVGALTFT
jgi:hypothetical protein